MLKKMKPQIYPQSQTHTKKKINAVESKNILIAATVASQHTQNLVMMY